MLGPNLAGFESMSDSFVAILLLLLGAFLLCWWLRGFTVRSRKSYELYCKAVAAQEAKQEAHYSIYQRSVELAEEGNHLRAEELTLLRQLIAELRTNRQEPGPPPARSLDFY